MKKIVAVFLAIIFIFSIFPMHIFAETIEETDKDTTLETIEESAEEELDSNNEDNAAINEAEDIAVENILSFSCDFDTESQTVNIKGTMNHDAFTSHRESVFVIYAVPPGRNESDVLTDESIKPLAEASVSITFAFSFKIKNIIDRYSRYAIFMRSPDGIYTLTTQAQFAETAVSSKPKNDKTAFKGIAGEYSFEFTNSKKAIIPVYLDSIISTEPTKYLFQIDEKQIFFDATYIENLDLQIRSLNFSDTVIYLQFLIRPNSMFAQSPNEDAEYILPNTYKYDTITLIHSIAAFLSSRYKDNNAYGRISGIVLGKAWDNAPKYNSFKNISINDYINLCGLYTMIVSNSAHAFNPELDIAISFSADGFLKEENASHNSSYSFSAKDVLSGVMRFFDEHSYSGISCSIFIETNATPLNLTADDLKSEIDADKEIPDDRFYIGDQRILSSYFNALSQEYKSASQYYNIIWIPNENIDGQLLSVAYSFAYYSLLIDKSVMSFIVDFSQQKDPAKSISELSYIFKNINGQEENVTKNALSFFKGDTWAEVLGVEKITLPPSKSYYSQDILKEVPDSVTGEFAYFDFSKEFLLNHWYAGSGCTNIKIDYTTEGIKALHSDFSNTNDGFADLIYYYEYSENISHTPYIKMNFEILGSEASSLYEIKFILQNEKTASESIAIVKGNQQNEIIIDLSKATNLTTLDSIKISLRSLDDSVDSCSLWLYDVTGYSEDHTSDELKTLIENEREKAKQEQDDQTDVDHRKTMFLVIGIVAFATLLGIVLLMLLRRNPKARVRD